MTPTLEQIMALHRYFVWADRMRVHFYQLVTAAQHRAMAGNPPPAEEQFWHPYMSYWYAGTYVVITGWRRLGLSDPEIDGLLTSPNVVTLERYRHGTFHFHPKYFDARFLEFTSSEESARWIAQLREAFGRWFLDYFKALESEQEKTNG